MMKTRWGGIQTHCKVAKGYLGLVKSDSLFVIKARRKQNTAGLFLGVATAHTISTELGRPWH